ncbi:hypothetical protein ONO12_28465, partial [Salmonella enterica subsp. enterica serovar Montevideo]|nr:hypothetical protein [Salmonella enterica subsp. enterica serovar Montevideo]
MLGVPSYDRPLVKGDTNDLPVTINADNAKGNYPDDAVCTHCQAINRIPDDRLQDAAKCGRCGHELFDGEVINATGETL